MPDKKVGCGSEDVEIGNKREKEARGINTGDFVVNLLFSSASSLQTLCFTPSIHSS